MIAKVIHIGNSLGIRIPKILIEECNIGDEVILEKSRNNLLIKPIQKDPRIEWEEQFRKIVENEDDELVLEDLGQNDFDDKEWEW